MQSKQSDLEQEIGLGLRSALNEDVLVDEEAYTLKTTDAKRLSRMNWEDLLRVKEGDQVIVYFRKDLKIIRDVFMDYPKLAAKAQRNMTKEGE